MDPAHTYSSSGFNPILGEVPQTAETSENKQNILTNLQITPVETAFTGCMSYIIQVARDLRAPLTYFGRSSETQKIFNEWTVTYLNSISFTKEEMNVATIVNSLWEKTKTYVDNYIKHCTKDARAFQTQQCFYALARYQEETNPEVKEHNGKTFTLRQIDLLFQINEELIALGKEK